MWPVNLPKAGTPVKPPPHLWHKDKTCGGRTRSPRGPLLHVVKRCKAKTSGSVGLLVGNPPGVLLPLLIARPQALFYVVLPREVTALRKDDFAMTYFLTVTGSLAGHA